MQEQRHGKFFLNICLYVFATLEGRGQHLESMKQEFKSCYVEVASNLQSHLLHNSTFIRDCRALHPEYKLKSGGQAAFGRLAYLLANVLKNTTGIYVKTPETVADELKRQYVMYQSVNIQYQPTGSVEKHWTTVSEFVGTDGTCCG